MLLALKQLEGSKLHLPSRLQDYPDQDRLDRRFEVFREAGVSRGWRFLKQPASHCGCEI